MRTMFVTGMRLLGILMLYWGLCLIPGVADSYFEPYRDARYQAAALLKSGWEVHPPFFGSAFQCVVSLVFAWVLVFRAEKVADALSVSEASFNELVSCFEDPLRMGIQLIGVYGLVRTIPFAIKNLFFLCPNGVLHCPYAVGELLFGFLEACLLALLVFYPDWVVDFIRTKRNEPSLRDAALDQERKDKP